MDNFIWLPSIKLWIISLVGKLYICALHFAVRCTKLLEQIFLRCSDVVYNGVDRFGAMVHNDVQWRADVCNGVDCGLHWWRRRSGSTRLYDALMAPLTTAVSSLFIIILIHASSVFIRIHLYSCIILRNSDTLIAPHTTAVSSLFTYHPYSSIFMHHHSYSCITIRNSDTLMHRKPLLYRPYSFMSDMIFVKCFTPAHFLKY